MILLALLLVGLPSSAVEVRVELGWGGQPVIAVVNPLWLTVSNPAAQPFSGEIKISGKVGSPWRGEALRTLRLPLFLAPFGRTVVALGWPVEPGMTALQVQVLSGGEVILAQDYSVKPGTTRLRGAIGPPGVSPDFVLSPSDLPQDPLLLWPFSELHFFFPLSSQAREVVLAWQAFLGGEVPGLRPGVISVQAEPIRQRLRTFRPSPPVWSVLVPGIILYLLALGPMLSRFSRGRAGLLPALTVVFLGLSVVYGVLREGQEGPNSVRVELFVGSVTRFRLELLGVVGWRGREWELSGWWHELLPSRGWTGFDLHWEYGPAGWTTRFSLTPGVPRVFLRLAEGPPEGGGEPTSPPVWLQRALVLSWPEAQVQTLPRESGEHEVFRVQLP